MAKREFLQQLLRATINKISQGGIEQEYSQVMIPVIVLHKSRDFHHKGMHNGKPVFRPFLTPRIRDLE
jgi:hypothetical protein